MLINFFERQDVLNRLIAAGDKGKIWLFDQPEGSIRIMKLATLHPEQVTTGRDYFGDTGLIPAFMQEEWVQLLPDRDSVGKNDLKATKDFGYIQRCIQDATSCAMIECNFTLNGCRAIV